MKTKKCGVYAALAAVLLITAILVFSCEQLTGDIYTASSGGKTFVPPPGKGIIIVELPDEAGRTIFPSAPTITNYVVHIINGGTPIAVTPADGTLDFGSNKEVFTVPSAAATYQVTVFGRNADDDIVAGGQAAAVAVNASGVGSATITMAPIIDDSFDTLNGTSITGTFTHTVTASQTTTVTVATTPYPLTSTPTWTPHTSGDPLAPGYYWVRATTAPLARYAPVVFSQILHVYGGQNSAWGTFVLTLNKNTYDVTYNENQTGTNSDTKVTDDKSGAGWTHAQPINILTAYNSISPDGGMTPAPGADPIKAGYSFDGWFTDDTAGDEWIFTITPIYKDTTLYAQYTLIPATGLTVTLVLYDHPTNPTWTLSSTSGSFTQAQALEAGAPDVTVTLTGTNPYDPGTFGWYYGADILVTNSLTLSKAGIDAALIPGVDLTVIGLYRFIFKGEIGGKAYASDFVINITP